MLSSWHTSAVQLNMSHSIHTIRGKPAGAAPCALPPGPGAQGLGRGAVLGALDAVPVPSVLPAVDAAPPAGQTGQQRSATKQPQGRRIHVETY